MERKLISFSLGSVALKAATTGSANPRKRKANVLDAGPPQENSPPKLNSTYTSDNGFLYLEYSRKRQTHSPDTDCVEFFIKPRGPYLVRETKIVIDYQKRNPLKSTARALSPSDNIKTSLEMDSVKNWQSLAKSSGAKKGQDFKTTSPNSKKSHSRNTSSSSSTYSRNRGSPSRGFRVTEKYIPFWGSILSNWTRGSKFSGAEAIAYLLPELDAINIKHLDSAAFATRLLATQQFVCGEQFMMACKSWLFEAPMLELATRYTTNLPEQDFNSIRDRLMKTSLHPYDKQEEELRNSSLLQILRTIDPKIHKEIGRTSPGFQDSIWDKASKPIVIAGCIARAEADQQLATVYLSNKEGNRQFVEGSPYDRIWGVGISWNDPKIEDHRNWRGANRLGKCHDEACKVFCERRTGKVEVNVMKVEQDNEKDQELKPKQDSPHNSNMELSDTKQTEIKEKPTEVKKEMITNEPEQVKKTVTVEEGRAEATKKWHKFAEKRGADETYFRKR